MLVIAGHIRIDPSKREAAIAAAVDVMEATRREKGCLAYTFSTDLHDEGLIHIFEEWDSQDALDAHFKSPHMATFQKAIPDLGVKEMKIRRYEVSSAGPLGG
ncbi:MAG: antibiotic biosynthesis monooxygenase [Myxococcales bacterium]|nr:antibiotic biosynthesis monooxygenase [Myxococcales bacterium]